MSNETFTVTESIVLAPGGDTDADGVIDPGETVRLTVHITNNSVNPGATVATGLEFSQILAGMTLVNQAGNDVNVSPIAFNDSYTAVGNTLLEVGNATAQTAPQSSIAGHVTDNDLEFFGDTFTISSFQATSAQGGTVTMVTSGAEMGAFTYVSAAGYTGADTFTYTIRDKGIDGIANNADDLVSTATVSINVTGQVWYVDSAAGGGGTGTSTNPFNTITAFSAANVDGANDTIYVRGAATGTLAMETGEQLVGQGASLDVSGFHLADAGSNSSIANASGTILTLGSGNTLAGITIGNGTGTANAISGTSFGTLTIGSSVAIDSGGGGLSLTTGAVAGSALTSTNSDGGTNNVSLTAVTGSLVLGTGALSGASGAAFNVVGGTVNTDYDGTISQGNFANTVGASGGHTGTLTFDGNITATGGEGLYFDNADGTYDFNGVYNANGGLAGVDILNGSGGTFTFDNASNVINHNAGGDAFTIGGTASGANVTWNGNITDNNGNAVNIANHNSGTVTFQNGTIASAGPSASGIDVTGNTSGTINFNDQVTLSTQGNTAVNLTSNTGATINFNPTGTGLDITTTTGTGFNATGGGTITVVDPAGAASNSISSGNGSALIVQNTTIGAADLTFESIGSSGGSANGIILDNTGSAGGLHITGTGSAGSGGTIGNKSGGDGGEASVGTGIYLNNTADVQLNNVSLSTFTNYGIRGLQVNGFQLTNSTVNSAGSTAGESNISFGVLDGTTGLTGTATITNTTFNGSFTHGLQVYNKTGTLNLTLDNVTANTNGDDGIQVRGFGTAQMNTEVKNSHFTSNHGDHFNATADAGAGMNVLFGTNGGNTLVGTAVDNSLGDSVTIQTGGQWSGTASANVSNNTITFAKDTPININAGGSGTMGATISNNTIGTLGVAGSGTVANEDAIRLVQNGDKGALGASANGGTLNALVSGNTLQQVAGRGIYVIGRDGGTAADPIQVNVTIQGNLLRDSIAATGQGILIESGASSTPTPDHVTIWADIGVRGPANTFTGDWGSVNVDAVDYDEIRVRNSIGGAGPANRFILTDYAGLSSSSANVATYLNTNNGLDGATLVGSATKLAANSWETAGAPPGPLTAAEFAPIDLQPYQIADQAAQPGDGSGDPAPAAGPGSDLVTPPPPSDQPPADDTPAPDASVIVDDGYLSQAELDFFVDAAAQRWIATGLTAAQVAALEALSFQIADMPGLTLGSYVNGEVSIDSDGAGRGWFADATPLEDGEFANVVSATRLTAVSGTEAAGRFDLLTTVMHEMGHALGLSDLLDAASRDNLLYGYLFAGERRLPGNDADGATPGSVTHEAFAGSLIQVVPDDGTSVGQDNVFNLPPGQSVDIQWDATIDGQSNQLIVNPQNSGTVTATNGAGFPDTASNTVTTVLDSLTLGGTVWDDNGILAGGLANGILAGGESGIAGVALTLFVDNGTVAGVWDASDTSIATTTTGAGGLYSFTELAEGDYIVGIDVANFGPGGALVGTPHSPLTSPEPIDPDNNVDNDDNGARAPGQAAYSSAITLAFNTEPTAGIGNDTNNTLDFAFFANVAPVLDLNTGAAGTGDSGTFTEGGAAVAIGAAISITDTADDLIESATITITDAIAGDALTVSGALPGGIIASGEGTGTLTLTGAASPAAYTTALGQIRFSSSGDNPTVFGTDTSRSITVVVNDGEVNSATATMTMTVVDDNDAPVLTLQDTSVSGTEDDPLVFNAASSNAITVADVDDASLTVTLTVLNGALTLFQTTGLSFGTGDGTGDATMIFSGTTANINAALEGLTYLGNLNYEGTDLLTVMVEDEAVSDSNVISIALADDGTIDGNLGNNVLNGTAGPDKFRLEQGGNDTVNGLDGNDGFYFGAAFTGADTVDGGDGTNDQIGLEGDYTGGNTLVLTASTITNVEVIAVLPGFDYNITTVDANVPGTTQLTIFAGNLGVGDNLTFNGSAESTGSFKVYGGLGTDIITTGGGNDAIYFGPGKFNPAADQVNGGTGTNDQLALDGDYTTTLTGAAIQNIDVIALLPGVPGDLADYNLTLDASLVGLGQALTIWGTRSQTDLTIDGSAVAGDLTLYGGKTSDRLTGGSGNDWIWGGADADYLNGNGGADTFIYENVTQSRATGFGFDTLIDFDDSVDKIDLPNSVSISGFAGPTAGLANAANLSADLQAANGAGILGLGQAVVFTANDGDLIGRSFLLIDANGTAGYQATGDFLIELVNPTTPIDQVGMFI